MKAAYQALLTAKKLLPDSAQFAAIEALNALTEQLVQVENQQKIRWFMPSNQKKMKQTIKGLYFHGRVGRGKTMLMDLFYQQLPIKRKKRIHFHHFMEAIHQQLNQLVKTDNPLTHIANTWAETVDLLCFDEFYVSDIGDAMLLAGLFEALFQQGVTLVCTSNCQPEQLYQNGLQRERFLPTIALIYKNCHVLSINGDEDYRLLNFTKHQYFYFPLAQGNERLSACFTDKLTQRVMPQVIKNQSIIINGRNIPFIAQCVDIIWFDFFALCSGPRSQRDYIKIADQHRCVFISNLPQFSGKLIPAVFSGVEDSYQRSGVLMGDLRLLDDEARRFIALVDEFYDRGVQLIISAEVDIEELYQGKQLAFEFQRCQSRLFEMQQW